LVVSSGVATLSSLPLSRLTSPMNQGFEIS